MANTNKKMEFLKTVKPIEKETFINFVNQQIHFNNAFDYNSIVKNNCHKNGYIDEEQLNDFMKNLYNKAYKNMQYRVHINKYSQEYMTNAVDFLSKPEYMPENLAILPNVDYASLMLQIKDYYNEKISIPYIQNGLTDSFYHLQSSQISYSTTNKAIDNFQLRLYLNLEKDNVLPFVNLFLTECEEKKLPFYFKFANSDNRNDNIVIYTNYDMASKMVETIEEVKLKNPEIFNNCKVTNPLMGVIHGYIGFGEEPVYKHSSFNAERSDALKQAYKCYLKDKSKELLNYSFNNVINSLGENLNFEDYLTYLIEKEYINGITLNPNDKNLVIKKIKEQIKNYIFYKLPPQNVTAWNGTQKHIIDIGSFPFMQKLCNIYGVQYYNNTHKTTDLINQIYLSNIPQDKLELTQKAVLKECNETINNKLNYPYLDMQNREQYEQMQNILNGNGPISDRVRLGIFAGYISQYVSGDELNSTYSVKYKIPIKNKNEPLDFNVYLSNNAIINTISNESGFDFAYFNKHLGSYLVKHDVSTKGKFMFLNNSTINELVNSGFDINEIGSKLNKEVESTL